MKIFFEPEFNEYYQKRPLVLVDVGASGGLESNWGPAKRHLQIIGFEPDKREFINLQRKQDSNIKYLNVGLYKEKTKLAYYLTEKQQTSSMFKPNIEFLKQFPEMERFDVTREEMIEVDSLDNQFQLHNIKDADFIKVDTQGSELFILEGAENTIKDCIFGVEAEVEFSEMYKGQPLFCDVDKFMRDKSFQLFDIQVAHWKRSMGKNYYKKKGQLIYGNALYLRKACDFKQVALTHRDDFERKSKVLNALSICLLYGYADYALAVLHETNEVFDKNEILILENGIKRNTLFRNKIPSFKGRRKISNLLYSLWEIMRPTHNNWATLDRKLGNP